MFPIASIKKVLVYLVFGLGAWFIYSSAKDYVVDNWVSSPFTTFLIGLAIITIVLMFYKFKLHNLVLK